MMLFFYFLVSEQNSPARHAKYIDDLKLYYEYEINELKSQLNRSRMGLKKFFHSLLIIFFFLIGILHQVVLVNHSKQLKELMMKIFVYMMKLMNYVIHQLV